MRLFVAIDLPEAIKAQVSAISGGLPGVRWTGPTQMHLTLRFIGEVDVERLEPIQTALAAIEFAPFELALRGVGQFPPQGAPRVLWVGVEAPPALASLAKQIDRAITALKLPPADKPFTAHLTLTRLKSAPNPEALRQFFSRNRDFRTPAFPVTAFTLYSSVLTPSGAKYAVEGEYEAQP